MSLGQTCPVCAGAQVDVLLRAPAGPVGVCRRCGFGAVVGDLDRLSTGYRASARPTDGGGEAGPSAGRDGSLRDWLAALLPAIVPAGPVMDIGLGNARVLARLGEGRASVGSAFRSGGVAAAESHGMRVLAWDPAEPGPVAELEPAGAVLAFDVLEVLPDIRSAFATAIDLLAPQGVLIAEMPVLPRSMTAAATPSTDLLTPDALWYPTEAALRRLLEGDLGAVVASSSYEDPPGLPRCLLLVSRSVEHGPVLRDVVERVLFGPVHGLRTPEERRVRALFEVVDRGRTAPEVVGLLEALTADDHHLLIDQRLTRLWARDLARAQEHADGLERRLGTERQVAEAKLSEAWKAADSAARQARSAAEELGAQRLLAEARLEETLAGAEVAVATEEELVGRLLAAEHLAGLAVSTVEEDRAPGPDREGRIAPDADASLAVSALPFPAPGRLRRGVRGVLFAGKVLRSGAHLREVSQGLRVATRSDARTIWRLRFDGDDYLRRYPDVAAAGLPPSLHYLLVGYAEGREPSRLFSARAYLEAHADVRRTGVNPLVHYALHGVSEGRRSFASDPPAGSDDPDAGRTDARGPRSGGRVGPSGAWPPSKPMVSVVASVDDADTELASLVGMLERQTRQDLQLVVVLAAPDSRAISPGEFEREAWRGSVVVAPDVPSATRSQRVDLGLRHAVGRYVVLLDHLVDLRPPMIEAAVFLAESERCDVVEGTLGRPLMPRPDFSPGRAASRDARLPGAWVMVRRSALIEAGGILDAPRRPEAAASGAVLLALPPAAARGWAGDLQLRSLSSALAQAGHRVIPVALDEATDRRRPAPVTSTWSDDDAYDLAAMLPGSERRGRFLHHLVERYGVETVLVCGADALGPHLSDLRTTWPHLAIVEQAMDDDRVHRDRRATAAVDLIVAPSDRVRRQLVEELREPWHRMRTILPALVGVADPPPDAATQASARREPGSVVGVYCQWSVALRPMDAAEIVRRITAAHPATFAFFGEGPLDPLMVSVLDRHGLADRVVPLGPDADVLRFVRTSDVLLLPSAARGAAMLTLLAMAAGKVVVASPAAGVQELIDDGRTGFLHPAQDTRSMIDQVDAVLRDASLRRRIGNEARRAVERDAADGRMVRQYLDALEVARDVAASRIRP